MRSPIDADIRFLSRLLGRGPDEICGEPHPWLRVGDGLDPNAERLTCTLAKRHDGRCSAGPLLWPGSDHRFGQFVVNDDDLRPSFVPWSGKFLVDP